MEPLLCESDRLVINTARRHPTTGQLCAQWDGNGLTVRHVEIVHGAEPTLLRLATANPNYAPITSLTKEARVVAPVLWTFQPPCPRNSTIPAGFPRAPTPLRHTSVADREAEPRPEPTPTPESFRINALPA
ncbi:hypothetical protein [Candidatus Rariloculus sp.]|uniref:hypothetical protein n=1 Tax=Candidatus Rariloculus sp. TaxID=3101265 RepID=UPI003D0DD597